jgi:hypothetical protein
MVLLMTLPRVVMLGVHVFGGAGFRVGHDDEAPAASSSTWGCGEAAQDDALLRLNRTATPSTPGWVYILTNEAMPGMVKIGLTTKTSKERAAELSSPSGMPLPFVVAWARAVSDCDYVEKAVHRMLDDKRESFRVDVAAARQVIEAAAGSMLGRRWLTPPTRKAGRGKGRRKRRGDI